jgi:dihydrofolate synthase/folylpolyglutamate synthase
MMTYSETVAWLFEQFPAYHHLGAVAYNPGLKNIHALSDYFGNPEKSLKFIHVAGTNGKGSVSNMTASILTESGEKVGLFTSPHLFDFTERIRINGTTIDQQFVIDFCQEVKSVVWEIQPSFFEITWMMALSYFNRHHCTMVVAEVGLGGRLDATNIIHPLLSVITNIGLEHTNFLGDTRAAIAGEKGGIIKENVPVVFGQYDQEIGPVYDRLLFENNTYAIPLKEIHEYPAGIFGYQKENFRIVATVCDYLSKHFSSKITPESILRGIKNLRLNTGFLGRMEQVGSNPTIWVDCAHNADGIRTLFENLPVHGKLHCIYGTSSDKNLAEIIQVLPKNATYYLTKFENQRSATIEKLSEEFIALEKNSTFFTHPIDAFRKAQESANKEDTIVIFGSFFLIHDFFEVFFKKSLAETK